MADGYKEGTTVSLKALVHKGSNKVIFAECGNDFLDVLFSLLTFPMGTISRLGSNHSVESAPMQIGCMKNLYASVDNIDVQQFHNEVRRNQLLSPRNAAESHCKDLKLKIDIGESTKYFLCPDWNCLGVSKDEILLSQFRGNLLSAYKGTRCDNCGKTMDRECHLSISSSPADQYKGIFVKELDRLIVTDDLQVLPPLSSTSFSFFTKLGVMDGDITEETFNIGVNEVLNLLISSFVSKTPLTETLLKHKPEPKFSLGKADLGTYTGPQMARDTVIEEEEKISVKLIVSKSREMVCFAEAGEDFVNLLFSFLTIPLGFILRQMRDSSWKGCIDQLYKSVQDLDDEKYLKSNDHKNILLSPKIFPGLSYKNHLLGTKEGGYVAYKRICVQDLDDEKYLKSNDHKNILLSPKIFPGLSYKNHLLGTKEGSEASYYYAYCRPNGVEDMLLTDKTLIPSQVMYTFHLKLVNDKSSQGFLKGPTMFTVTDKLIVMPISPIFGFSILNELNVPLDDIKEEIVQVGKEEVLHLLVASIAGDSALTDAFITQRKK